MRSEEGTAHHRKGFHPSNDIFFIGIEDFQWDDYLPSFPLSGFYSKSDFHIYRDAKQREVDELPDVSSYHKPLRFDEQANIGTRYRPVKTTIRCLKCQCRKTMIYKPTGLVWCRECGYDWRDTKKALLKPLAPQDNFDSPIFVDREPEEWASLSLHDRIMKRRERAVEIVRLREKFYREHAARDKSKESFLKKQDDPKLSESCKKQDDPKLSESCSTEQWDAFSDIERLRAILTGTGRKHVQSVPLVGAVLSIMLSGENGSIMIVDGERRYIPRALRITYWSHSKEIAMKEYERMLPTLKDIQDRVSLDKLLEYLCELRTINRTAIVLCGDKLDSER